MACEGASITRRNRYHCSKQVVCCLLTERKSLLLAVFFARHPSLTVVIPIVPTAVLSLESTTQSAIIRLVSLSAAHRHPIGVAGTGSCFGLVHPGRPLGPQWSCRLGDPRQRSAIRHPVAKSISPLRHCEEVQLRAAAPRHAILDFHQALGEAGPLDLSAPAGGDRHSRLKPSASKSG